MSEDKVQGFDSAPEDVAPVKKPVKEVAVPVEEAFVGFEVTEDTKTSDFVRFPVEAKYKAYKAGEEKSPFHTAYIAGVERKIVVKKEYELLPGVVLDGDEKPNPSQVTPESLRYTVVFHFVSPDGVFEHYHTFWDIQPDDPKAANKKRTLSEGLGHFYNALVLRDEAKNVFNNTNYTQVLDRTPKNWGDVFDAVVLIFNEGAGGTPVYHKDGKPFKVRIKLVFGQNGGVEMPYFGDKVERIIEGMPSRLQIKKDDKFIAPEKPAGPVIGAPGIGTGDDEDFVASHFG